MAEYGCRVRGQVGRELAGCEVNHGMKGYGMQRWPRHLLRKEP